MIIPDPHEILRWSRPVQIIRGLEVLAGAGALVAGGWGGGIPLVVTILGAFGLLSAAANPAGLGPGVVIAGAGLGWVLHYGVDTAPVLGTVLLTLALAAHHQTAALAAALPNRARVHRDVLVRFGRHGGIVLILTAGVATLALALGKPGGSVPLELIGVVAVVAAIAVPVVLSRAGARSG
ncbi:MAG TPA: hypothetical protein VGP36_21345 [Mycobacteriales bacterium]|jgi:hypothetical protein|nr:hypothetical protein [Mycobacteriales bacterium]